MTAAGNHARSGSLARSPHPSFEDIRVESVGAGQWRVVDLRESRDSGQYVIGFIEKSGGIFAVTVLDNPGRAPASYPTLHDARESFTG